MGPIPLRHDLRTGASAAMRRRRAIIGLSLAGMAAMAPVSLLQTGVVEHLPDPPVGPFHSDQANLSEVAYQLGLPDGTLALASLAANVPLAAWGGEDRAQQQPLAPLAAAGKALVDAIGAASYFWQMASGKQPWCPYCITGAIANFAILALSVPEAVTAVNNLSEGQTWSHTPGRQPTASPSSSPR
jgi:uncharacterized membrane protein